MYRATDGNAGRIFIAMNNYYRDDTAWIAIANVMRQQKREEWIREHQKPPVEKKERLPGPPVDVKRIQASGHAIIHINRAEWAYRKMLRAIEENKENDR